MFSDGLARLVFGLMAWDVYRTRQAVERIADRVAPVEQVYDRDYEAAREAARPVGWGDPPPDPTRRSPGLLRRRD